MKLIVFLSLFTVFFSSCNVLNKSAVEEGFLIGGSGVAVSPAKNFLRIPHDINFVPAEIPASFVEDAFIDNEGQIILRDTQNSLVAYNPNTGAIKHKAFLSVQNNNGFIQPFSESQSGEAYMTLTGFRTIKIDPSNLNYTEDLVSNINVNSAMGINYLNFTEPFFVVSSSAGVWSGSSLNNLNDVGFIQSFNQITRVGLTDTFYAVRSVGVYVSTDKAASWTLLANQPTGTIFHSVLYSNHSNSILVRSNAGTHGSTDSGTSWTTIDATVGSEALKSDISGQNIILTGATNCLLSSDGGLSFSPMPSVSYCGAGDISPDGTKIVIVKNNASAVLYYSSDSGASFSGQSLNNYYRLSMGNQPYVSPHDLIAYEGGTIATISDFGLIATDKDGSFKLTNTACRYTLFSPTGQLVCLSNSSIYFYDSYGQNPAPTTVSPAIGDMRSLLFLDANTVVVATNIGYYRSIDGGLNWALISTIAATGGLQASWLFYNDVTAKYYVCARDGSGSYVSTDFATWTASIPCSTYNKFSHDSTGRIYRRSSSSAYSYFDDGVGETTVNVTSLNITLFSLTSIYVDKETDKLYLSAYNNGDLYNYGKDDQYQCPYRSLCFR